MFIASYSTNTDHKIVGSYKTEELAKKALYRKIKPYAIYVLLADLDFNILSDEDQNIVNDKIYDFYARESIICKYSELVYNKKKEKIDFSFPMIIVIEKTEIKVNDIREINSIIKEKTKDIIKEGNWCNFIPEKHILKFITYFDDEEVDEICDKIFDDKTQEYIYKITMV